MEYIAQLLNPAHASHSYRRALVGLWVLASDDQRLNQWEQAENESTIAPFKAHILSALEQEKPLDTDTLNAHPLALIRALDDYLASIRLPSSQSSSVSQRAYTFTEADQPYWLVPVTLAGRRSAAMNRQSARLARWFHHHAVLPGRTVQGIEVTCTPSRSALHVCLQALATQQNGQLKVWVAHFDDGADVVWDRTRSPVGNWRTQSVEPHPVRQASMLATLYQAAQAGAQVVVFPEFTLDSLHTEQLRAHLRQSPSSIQMVVAGAFHTEAMTLTEPATFNTAPVLSGHGSLLFAHRKLRLFGNRDDGTEFAQVGNQLHVLVTPIGCMTVLICKDFLDEDPRVNNLLAEVPVDWVWVPSYGDDTTLKAHKARAKKLATVTTGSSCAVAQTQNTALKKDGEVQTLLPGFGHAAGDKAARDVPTTGGLIDFALTTQPLPAKRARQTLKRVK
ncbi:MAG: hypothetical protein RLZZ352_416 [Pseudomonadota bacterium]|jgi:hypothetical protein